MLRGMAGHGLVDGVVDDLPDEVVQTADIGRADVHAGSPSHGIEALEDLDGVRGVAAPSARLAPRARRAPRRRRRDVACSVIAALPSSVVADSRSTRRPRSSSSYQAMVMRPPLPARCDRHLRPQRVAQLGLHVLDIRIRPTAVAATGSAARRLERPPRASSVCRTDSPRADDRRQQGLLLHMALEAGERTGVPSADGAHRRRPAGPPARSQGYAACWRSSGRERPTRSATRSWVRPNSSMRCRKARASSMALRSARWRFSTRASSSCCSSLAVRTIAGMVSGRPAARHAGVARRR